MLYYLDTSVLLKLYFQESGSASMEHLVATPGVQLAISTLAVVEFRAAVRAQQRRTNLSAEFAAEVLGHFGQKLGTVLIRQVLSDAVIEVAELLLDRHPLRAPDAIQLGGCVVLGQTLRPDPPIFTCSDGALLAAARAEHIPCWNPAAAAPPG